MHFFTRIVSAVRERPYLYGAILLVVLAGGWYWLYGKSGPAVETLTVEPKDFLEQTSVSGAVKASQDVDLGFSQSGRVVGVYAKVGDVVPAGKVLAAVENGDLVANVRAAEAKLASLKVGTRSEQLAVTEAQVEGDKTALVQANQALMNALADAYTKSDDAVRNKVDQFYSNPRTNPQISFYMSDPQLRMTLESERSEIENMLVEWQGMSASLRASGDLSAATTKTEANLTHVIQFLSLANNALNKAITNTSVSQTTINGWSVDVATARANANASLSALNTAATAAKNAATALDKDQKNLALLRAGSTQEDIAAQQAQVDAARAQLAKTLIVAPFTGTVTKMDAKVGAIVSPNTPEVSLISEGVFQIESFIPEVNIALVSVGNTATATLDAYGPNTPFAVKVVAIDPAETEHNGVSTYKTTLQFLESDQRIRTGMTANVVITTGKKPNAIVIPQGAVVDKNGQKFVTVLSGEETTEIPVTIGVTSALGEVEVLTGLRAGDKVVLSPAL